ncbi:MAG: hypothetical protein A2176_16210 [Spirochaetes bacterium RBG_13_51_14]|nr:MAG: hypothetical protein A2176_16210 [Spirochaetes bacterium RBG_13_51_14]
MKELFGGFMKKGVIIGIIITALAALLAIAGFIIFSKDDLEAAIDEFEDGDYKEAIIILNRLAKTADYDAGEKIYYYRCRSINGLAGQLENRFDDELAETAQEKKDSEDFREAKNDIEDYLERLNMKIDGDLILIPAMKKSRIVPRGKFYDEFTARYRGSALIEDLQFESIQNMGKTEPDKLVPAMINFYNKYPNTDYISGIVRILFDGLQSGTLGASGSEEVLLKIILKYANRYPTSPETGRLYTCTGDNVNLRNGPGVDGRLVGKTAKDDILIQLEKSMDTTQVGDTRDYWYRVASLKGPKGWIFGKFLRPIDLAHYRAAGEVEQWTLDERFAEWSDSHTPLNWTHIPGGEPASINFSMQGDKKIAEINSSKGSASGLYTRYNTTRAFSIASRARFTGGDAVTIFAYAPGGGTAFSVKLSAEQVSFSGRTIPLQTAEWHEYRLSSDDGRFAKLIIDGEAVSSRIEPVKNAYLTSRGVYCLYSSKDEHSRAEMEYIKVR